MKSRGELKTEQQNPQSSQIDSMSINDILKTINREDQNVAIAVQATLPDIEKTVVLTVNSIQKGGRVFYVGAGTSGRLGVLDASEIPPTFSAPKGLFIGVIAGGENALRNSIEGAEDRPEEAIIDLEQYELNENDTLVGISCSGAANYVVSALDHAKANGAKTVYLVTNLNPFKITEVDVIINAVTGPEVVTGSTRMKAGTATKLILNMISTATMIKLGKVYGNLMVDLMVVNDKLVDRGTRIIEQLTDLDYDGAQLKLFEAKKSVKAAIVMEKLNCTLNEAREKLDNAGGFLRNLID
ncbi:MAG: N-acetylmuramic acid 6-phosphate etherase [Candidatus Marinimicrobia bacterium]|jgi:N-acetylmuramic acid 6-phosphate etherase|nr:N-acetylmuramic acid 6-phosphate etherase [Candidatus Neomarinimicrobiota bacterium]MBT4053651.1 N-acetylmuramic acid 6-phosphate etherase [Candidatus Neomarinimicrobiota bacterium]MBT4371009.1 N-acetylmuramic acid 6-phosphate etherase [Candidatus Neomarinimicrobiota bacterium]MBT4661849.1 N-acetylmuramic acid 6-phosphate etherase [Candidatus Neomarinimicrobiota bacterium]MBT4827649.1 N-acetylmuramic acid 6-phosphate etherase [Candidatus Neomarinimicrobiota bacterium]